MRANNLTTLISNSLHRVESRDCEPQFFHPRTVFSATDWNEAIVPVAALPGVSNHVAKGLFADRPVDSALPAAVPTSDMTRPPTA